MKLAVLRRQLIQTSAAGGEVLFGLREILEPIQLDLVLFLQATLLFLGGKIDRRPIMAAGLRVAIFYELPGILDDSPQLLSRWWRPDLRPPPGPPFLGGSQFFSLDSALAGTGIG